ncbi:MAG TPA: molybdate ABC transporter substrate-binding protein [Steroidobacteraceae bacterium]|nr:molybdate ABC transporter substrate-binding protein [Steroidobacteraceae bacterium]
MKNTMSRAAALLAALIVSLPLARPAVAEDSNKPELLVLAAASLTNVLGELSPAWTKSSGVAVKLSFAASSVLARQVEAGGKADVFVSADQEWMDYLDQRSLIDKPTRRNLVGNRLVLIAPADSTVALDIKPGFDLLGALKGGRLSTGDPDTVPVGKYARSALTSLGVWNDVADKLVRADNVRSAMMFVARGEAPLGIVYTTDALVDKKVRVVATFPENTHAPITYPGATIKGSRPEAAAYLLFLAGAEAAPVWKKYGFLETK